MSTHTLGQMQLDTNIPKVCYFVFIKIIPSIKPQEAVGSTFYKVKPQPNVHLDTISFPYESSLEYFLKEWIQ